MDPTRPSLRWRWRVGAATTALALLALLAPAAAAACEPALDPPAQMRNGDDFLELPLAGANASLAGCVALCCAHRDCVAFSYNYPQPSSGCVGGSCCVAGAHCCMLKSAPALPLVPNPWPGAVQTGSVPAQPPLPGPTPPFEVSTDILSASFANASKYWPGDQGDTWPSAWLPDDSLVGWDCDSHGSPMSLWRLDGDPYATNLTPSLVGGLQPIDYAKLCAYLGKTGAYPYINVKPGGMTALPDGTLLAGISCMNYGDDPAFNRQHNLAGFVARSTDAGLTWTNATAVGAFSGRFSAPVFVSCGKANDGDCLADGVLYVFFPGADNDAAYWDNNDVMFLARVPPSRATDPSAFEFFAGLDGSGLPTWTPDSSQAAPSLEFHSMVGENAVSYNPYLRKYLVANFGFIDLDGIPRPWHTAPFMTPHRTQLILLEADHPFGPWKLFYRSDDSPPAPGLYTPTFPSKFMRPVSPGGTAQMQMFYACLGGPSSCRYTLNYVEVTLALAKRA